MDNLRIVGVPEDPYVTPCFDQFPSGHCPIPGVEITFLHTILTYAGFNIQWIKAATYEEAVAILNNDTADMPAWSDTFASTFLEEGLRRKQTLLSALPVMPLTLVFGKNEQTSVRHVLYDAFALPTWALLATSLGLWYVVVHEVITVVMSRLRVQEFSSFRGIDAGWGIFLALILGVYGNLLTIRLYSPNVRVVHPFRDLRDLAGRIGRSDLITQPYYKNLFPAFFGEGNISHGASAEEKHFHRLMKDGLRLNPATELDDNAKPAEILEEMLRLEKRYKCPIIVADYIAGEYFLHSRQGNLVALDLDLFTSEPLAYSIRKTSYHAQKRISIAFAAGSLSDLYRRILSRFYAAARVKFSFEASKSASMGTKMNALQLEQVFDAFTMLTGGLLLSGFLVCLEILIARIDKQ